MDVYLGIYKCDAEEILVFELKYIHFLTNCCNQESIDSINCGDGSFLLLLINRFDFVLSQRLPRFRIDFNDIINSYVPTRGNIFAIRVGRCYE